MRRHQYRDRIVGWLKTLLGGIKRYPSGIRLAGSVEREGRGNRGGAAVMRRDATWQSTIVERRPPHVSAETSDASRIEALAGVKHGRPHRWGTTGWTEAKGESLDKALCASCCASLLAALTGIWQLGRHASHEKPKAPSPSEPSKRIRACGEFAELRTPGLRMKCFTIRCTFAGAIPAVTFSSSSQWCARTGKIPRLRAWRLCERSAVVT